MAFPPGLPGEEVGRYLQAHGLKGISAAVLGEGQFRLLKLAMTPTLLMLSGKAEIIGVTVGRWNQLDREKFEDFANHSPSPNQ